MASIWGGDSPSVAWNVNSWESNTFSLSITGLSFSASLGDVAAYPEQGWGSDTYGYENWGSSGYRVEVSGVSFTAYVNADGVESYPFTGWGRAQYGEEPYGDSDNPVVAVSGLSITSEQGTAIAYPEQGWGRDTWGAENWGESAFTVEIDGFEVGTVESGQGGYGNVAYGYSGWGMWTLTPADAVGLSG